MEPSCVKVRLRPGSLARVRQWASELRARSDEVMATLEDEGVILESVFLDSSEQGDYLIHYVRAPSLDAAQEAVSRSVHPIDAYHRQFKVDAWESRTPLELLIDFERG
ncbi:MAG: DUF6176 family protein [Candidatus Limnocylindrales bacterium]